MTGGVHFNPNNNNNNARFINNNMQADKLAAAKNDVPTTILPKAAQNGYEMITQSARSLANFLSAQSAQMQGKEMSLMLKDMLNMQKDIQTFLTSMADSQAAAQMTKADIAKLLMGSQMDLGQLKLFMQQNGKESLSKLFNMTSNFNQSGVVARSSQMSEMIALLNACTPNADTSQVQVLKNMMLLYLPWLPLGEQNFSLEIGQSGAGEENGEGGEDTVTILISTVNFGNVQVLIFKSDKSTVNFNITTSRKFSKDQFSQALNSESKEYNVQTNVNFEKKESLEKTVKPQTAKTQVSVNTSRHVNPFLILMAQTTVRIIIDFDKNYSLVENRKEKL